MGGVLSLERLWSTYLFPSLSTDKKCTHNNTFCDVFCWFWYCFHLKLKIEKKKECYLNTNNKNKYKRYNTRLYLIVMKDRRPFTSIFTPMDNLEWPINLSMPQVENPERTHTDTGRCCEVTVVTAVAHRTQFLKCFFSIQVCDNNKSFIVPVMNLI